MGSLYAVYTVFVCEIPTHDRSDPRMSTTLTKSQIGKWFFVLGLYLYPWVIAFILLSSAGILFSTVDALDSFVFFPLLSEILLYCACHVCSIIVLLTTVPNFTLIGLSIVLILLSIVIGLLSALYLFLMDSSRNFGDFYEYIML